MTGDLVTVLPLPGLMEQTGSSRTRADRGEEAEMLAGLVSAKRRNCSAALDLAG
jgi:hypothetical protein